MSGLALAASFVPLDWEPLAWVALVPLLLALRGCSPVAAFGIAWLSGFAFHLGGFHWTASVFGDRGAFGPEAASALLLTAGLLACPMGLFGAGVGWLADRGMPVLALVTPLWVSLEWLGASSPLRLPWELLGCSQYRFHDLVQIADVTGIYGISATVMLVNALAADALACPKRRRRQATLRLVAAAALPAALGTLGRLRAEALATDAATARVTVAAVQGSWKGGNDPNGEPPSVTLWHYRDLTERTLGYHPQLIVWPQNAVTFFFQAPGPLRDTLLDLAREGDTYLLFESPAARHEPTGTLTLSDRAYLISSAGHEVGFRDRRASVFRRGSDGFPVPFLLDRTSFSDDTTPAIFDLPQGHLGLLFRHEGILPSITRTLVREGADILVNIGDDQPDTQPDASLLMIAHLTLRAVENRVPIIRVASRGGSASIDRYGHIRWLALSSEPLWHVDELQLPETRTFYTRFGDIFAWFCVFVTVVAFGLGVRRNAYAATVPDTPK